jgi:hypothetical protein
MNRIATVNPPMLEKKPDMFSAESQLRSKCKTFERIVDELLSGTKPE